MFPPRFFSQMLAHHCVYWLTALRRPVTVISVDHWLRYMDPDATDDEICAIADALICMGYFN